MRLKFSIPAPPETFGTTQLAVADRRRNTSWANRSRKAKLTWSLVARDEPLRAGRSERVRVQQRDLRFPPEPRARPHFAIQCAGRSGDRRRTAWRKIATALPVNPKAPQPRAAKLLCEVTDLNQQTVSESRAFVQHSSRFYFGLKRFDAVVLKEGAAPADRIDRGAARWQAARRAGARRRFASLASRWQTNRLATAGNTTEFESKPQLQMVWERELTTHAGPGRRPQAGDRTTRPMSLADKPGEYLLEAVGKDAGGRDVLTSMVVRCRRRGRDGLELPESLRDRSRRRQGQLRARANGDAPGEDTDRGRCACHRGTRPRPALVHRPADRQRALRPGADRGDATRRTCSSRSCSCAARTTARERSKRRNTGSATRT